MRVCILGCGPAGMMAAHMVERNGLVPVIVSASREASYIRPDMFLQKPVPGLNKDPHETIAYGKRGTGAGYAEKVYGNADVITSWDKIEVKDGEPLWWLDQTYHQLWAMYSHLVIETTVTPETVVDIMESYSLVLSTLPAKAVCLNEDHRFATQEVYYISTPADPLVDPATNFMLYDGTEETGWYRFSRLREIDTWEYTIDRLPWQHEVSEPLKELRNGVKLIGNDCDCHPALNRVGRWAQWERGVLNHHVIEHVTGILAGVGLAN